MATDFRFSGNDILSFIYFFENVLAITERPVLKKNLISARGNRILFLQTLIRMEAVFRYSEIVFFNECFILGSGNGSSVNYKPCAFAFI